MSETVWVHAGRDADLTLTLPGELPLLFRRIAAIGRNFTMGSRGNNPYEEPRHLVKFGYDFHLGTFVVTQEQWEAVAGRSKALRERINPSHFKGPRRPVEQVSWDDATAWCAALEALPGFPAGWNARLPTEAEWEYACWARSDTDYYNGDGKAALAEVGWYSENSNVETHPVDEAVGGRPEEHPHGLFGMHGNVWEWCADVYRNNAYRTRLDGEIAAFEDLREGEVHADHPRVVRGGSWDFPPGMCRSASRYWGYPGVRYWSLGFRLCLAPGPAFAKASADKPLAASPAETDKAEAARGRARRRPGRPESSATDAAGAGGEKPEGAGAGGLEGRSGGTLDCGDLSPLSTKRLVASTSSADLSAASLPHEARDEFLATHPPGAGDKSPGEQGGDKSPQSKD